MQNQLHRKVENILICSLDTIPSPLPSLNLGSNPSYLPIYNLPNIILNVLSYSSVPDGKTFPSFFSPPFQKETVAAATPFCTHTAPPFNVLIKMLFQPF